MNKKRAGRRKEKLFGKDLSAVTGGVVETPAPILSLITYLRNNALDEPSLFRSSPSKDDIEVLKERLDKDMEVQWNKFDIATLAGLLKAYVRELPEPLIPTRTYIYLADVLRIEGRVPLCQYLRQSFLDSIDESSMVLLREVIGLLRDVLEHSARNKMNMKGLTTIWAPNLIRHADLQEEMQRLEASRMTVQYMIEYYDDLFG